MGNSNKGFDLRNTTKGQHRLANEAAGTANPAKIGAFASEDALCRVHDGRNPGRNAAFYAGNGECCSTATKLKNEKGANNCL
ncbi:MAG: hypothetical protein ACRECY_20340, partial [Phyllobacterium sp.]